MYHTYIFMQMYNTNKIKYLKNNVCFCNLQSELCLFFNDVYVYITIGLSLYYECFILWAAEFIIFNFITYKLKLICR